MNVSEGGLFLRTATPLPPGTRAVVTIRVEGGDVIADAEVVWVATPGARLPGMGVRLVQIHQGAERLASLLARAATGLS